MTRFFRSFLNDEDGFSAKDFLMVLFGGLYAVFLIVAFITPYFGIVNPVALEIIHSMNGLIMTIVGGVFAVQSVREFRNPVVNQTTANNYNSTNPSIYDGVPVKGRNEEDVGVDPDSNGQHRV
jgi:hypothetical protein